MRSTTALVAAALACPVVAAISNVSPEDGDVVTVDTSAPNPDPRAVTGTDSANVTVGIGPGAGIDHRGPSAVSLGPNGEVDNAGTLSADNNALRLSDGGRVNNAGLITTTGANAIDLNGVVDVVNAGTITAASSAILFGGTHDNRLALEPGSTITGFIDAGDGTDTLTLGGAVGSQSFNLDDVGDSGGENFRGFEEFTKEGASTWVLTGTGDQDWTVNSGVLRVDGTLTGRIALAGGTLRVRSTADLGTAAISVGAGGGTLEPFVNVTTLVNDIALAGDLTVAGDQTLILDGNLTGRGGLIENGTRNVFLRGTNTFAGDVIIRGNALVAVRGNAVPDGAVVQIDGDASFSTFSRETIGGLAGAGSVGVNGQVLTLNVDAGDSLRHSGTLQATAGATDLLIKTGPGTQTLAGRGPVELGLQLDRGTLVIDGDFAGPTTVTAGTLGGRGSVGPLSVGDATLAPGNAIGTLTVLGDVGLGGDSTYRVELDGNGTSDLIDATGRATLAAGTTLAVTVVANDNLVANRDRYTVLSADGGIVDNGAQVTGDFAGFSFTGAVVGNDYLLTAESEALVDAVGGATAGAVALALDVDGPTADADLSAFIATVRNQTPARAQRTLDATTPRTVAATQVVNERVSERFHDNLGGYLRGRRLGLPQLAQRRDPSFVGGLQLASAAATDPLLLAAYFSRSEAAGEADPLRTDLAAPAEAESPWGGFGAVYGVRTDRDAAPDATGTRSDTRAAQAGLDHRFNDRLRLGVSVNYAKTELDFDNVAGDHLGDGQVNALRAGPYAAYTDGPWSADASLTVGYQRNEAVRQNPGTGDRFDADYDGFDLAAHLGGGYRIDLGRWRLTPHLGVQYLHGETNGYRESGGPGALVVDDASFDALRGTAGLGLARLFDLGRVRLMPRVEVGYAYDLLDDVNDLSARFVGGTTNFTVAASNTDGGSVFYGAGLTGLVGDRTALDLDYFGETSADDQIDTLRLTLRLMF